MSSLAIRRTARQGVDCINGATLVEFALVLPIFLVFVIFIFDLGQALYRYIILSGALRDAARVAAVNGPGCQTAVASAMTAALTPYNLQNSIVSVSPCLSETVGDDADYTEPRFTQRVRCRVTVTASISCIFCGLYSWSANAGFPVRCSEVFAPEHPDSCT